MTRRKAKESFDFPICTILASFPMRSIVYTCRDTDSNSDFVQLLEDFSTFSALPVLDSQHFLQKKKNPSFFSIERCQPPHRLLHWYVQKTRESSGGHIIQAWMVKSASPASAWIPTPFEGTIVRLHLPCRC